MTTLGVTGGIGSGKSAFVARLGAHDGVRVVLADEVAKRLMVEDPEVRRRLVEQFGPGVYAADGSLDRAAVAAHVFADEAELAALNAIVHPAVRRALRAEIDRAEADGVALLVYEAALLFEFGGDQVLDRVVVVDAPVETRIARVMARDGVSREAVLARMRHQLGPAESRARADLVVTNDGDLAALHAEADRLVASLGVSSPSPRR